MFTEPYVPMEDPRYEPDRSVEELAAKALSEYKRPDYASRWDNMSPTWKDEFRALARVALAPAVALLRKQQERVRELERRCERYLQQINLERSIPHPTEDEPAALSHDLRQEQEKRLGEYIVRSPNPSKYHGQQGFEIERFLSDYYSWIDEFRSKGK